LRVASKRYDLRASSQLVILEDLARRHIRQRDTVADDCISLDDARIRFSDYVFFFSSRRRHTRSLRDWSSDVCSSDLSAHKAKARSMPRTSVTFPPKLYKALEELARKKKVSLAWIVREAAEQYVSAESHFSTSSVRSEERRVGKECRLVWAGGNEKNKK